MSKINKVLSNIDQSDPSTGGFTEEEKARIRNNIGAMSSVDSSVMREIGKSVPTGDAGKINDDDYVATNLTSDSKGIIFKTVLNLLDWIKGKLGISSSGDETLFMNQKGAWVAPPDTTYESKEELENSNEVSLVTRGEKFTWNHKQDDVGIDPANGDPDKYLNQQGDWATPPKYFDRDAAEGGTDESLVLTGDKFRWNQIDGVMELIPADASPSNKLVTMAQLADFGGFAIVPLTNTTPKVPDPSAATPPVDLSTKIIYLTKVLSDPNDPAKDKYEEWIYTGDPSQPVVISSWECIGEATVDLSNYYTKGEVDTLLADKISRNEVSVVVLTDPTKQTINLKTGLSINVVVEHQDITGKQDVISDLQTIREGAAAGATAVQPGDLATVATSGSYNDLDDKPHIPADQVNADWNAASGSVAEILNKPSLATVATSGSYNDLGDKPHIPADQVNADWNASSGSVAEILNKPSLATVATSGSYNDLDDKPHIPADQVNADWNAASGVAKILNKPTTLSGYGITDASINNGVITLGSNTITPLTSQANADWNASSGVAKILNKPTTLSGYGITDASISGNDITLGSDTITVPPGVKVLEYGVSTWQDFLDAYNNGYHIYVIWKDTSAQPNPTLRRIGQLSYVNVVNNVPDRAEFSYVRAKTSEIGSLIVYTLYADSTWGTTSTKFVNMQDGTNTTVTRTNYNFKVNVADDKVLPAHSSSDEGKALRVDSNGDAVWTQDTMVVTATYDYSQGKMVSNYTYDEIRDAIISGGNVRVIAYDQSRYQVDTLTLSHIDYGTNTVIFQGINMGLTVKNDGTVDLNSNLGLRESYAPRRKYYTGWSIDMGNGRDGNAPVLMITNGALCWYNVTVTGDQVKQDSCYSSITIRVPYGMEPTEVYTNDIYIKLTFNAWASDRAVWSDWCGVELDIIVRLGIPTETRSANTTMYTFSNGPLRWELSKKITFPSNYSHNEYLLHIVGDTLEIKEYGS